MSKQISAVLPEDVAEMLKREQKGRSVNVTIVEALRAHWVELGTSHPFEPTHTNCIGCEPQAYPVFGSIPANGPNNGRA
jgi:hypothetical protein